MRLRREQWLIEARTTSLSYSNANSTQTFPLTSIRLEKTKHKNFDFVHLLSFFLFIKYNWKPLLCMRILNIPNDCSADKDHSYLFSASCERLLASYGLKTASKTLRMLGRRLLEFLFTYSGLGTYSQATPRLPNVCVTGCDELHVASNQQWVFSKQRFDYSFLYLLGLEDQFSATKDVDTFWISAVW